MSESPLDPQAIAGLRSLSPDDGGELLRELAELFQADLAKRLDEIAAAVAAGDAELLGRAAHTIKGSAANFGASRLTELALQLERFGREGNVAAVSPLLPAFKAEAARVSDALAALVRGT
jgi:HPt (histidine-containing phosphotransfer) domain-containing protein